MAAAVALYFGVRALTHASRSVALSNARHLIDLERALGIQREANLQSLILDHHFLVDLVNWIYIWGHWPVIVPVGLWLMARHPKIYRTYRNAFFISGGIGLVVFVIFPVAPPRLALTGVTDTVTVYSSSYRVLQPPSLEDIYASLPSLHVGWDLLIGLGLVQATSHRSLKLLGWSFPFAMAAAVVLTANHYLLDVVAGAGVALIGLALATSDKGAVRSFLRRLRPRGPTDEAAIPSSGKPA